MSYQIRYGCGSAIKEINHASKMNMGWKRFAAVGCAAIISIALLSHEKVQQFLIPGVDSVTKQAFAVFTEALRNGEPMIDAAEAFCREIISFETQ